jgi:hypothetical protein
MATLIRVDRNGTKYYEGLVKCERCGGMGGHDKWAYTGWTCYECGGSGLVNDKWKVYTPEYEEKLNARREARRQKYLEEHAEEIARKEAERIAKEEAKAEAERLAKEEAERQAKEEAERKTRSQYIGEIGGKVDMELTYDHTAWWEQPSYAGFGTDTMYLHCFRDNNENLIVWKTSKAIGKYTDEKLTNWECPEKGQKVKVKGTIKEHKEYAEEKQTVLTRCKVLV